MTIDSKKTIVSIALGLAGTAGSLLSFNFAFPPHRVTIVWGLFLPMLAALAYGWRHALIAVTLGGAGFISFILWPTSGWANVVTVVLYVGWYLWQGYCADLRRRKTAWWNNIYGAQALYAVFYNVLLFGTFPWIFRFNPPFWYPAAATSMPYEIIAGIAVKETFMMFLSVYASDLLLHLPAIRRIVGLPVSSSMRIYSKILLSTVLISFTVMVFFSALEGFLFEHDFAKALTQLAVDDIKRLVILIVLLSTAAGLQLAKSMEKRIDAEDALRASEERFFTIFNSVNDAIFIHDADTGVILDVNKKMCEMFGYSRKEALMADIGKLSSGISPYTLEDAVTKVRRAASGEPQLVEWHCKHKDGRLFWGEINMKRASIGGTDRVLVTVRDVTERKLAAEKLQESERRYRTLFESANDAILLMRYDRFVACNTKALDMFGCTRGQILGKAPYSFSPPTQPDLKGSMEKAIEKMNTVLLGHPQIFEWVYNKRDGTPFTAEVSLNSVELGTRTFIQAIVRDITERKRVEQALMREKVFSNVVIDSLPGVFYICDEEGKLLRWNNNEKETTGYSIAELSEMNVLKLFHKDRQLVATKMHEVLDSGRSSLEASLITKSGTPIPFYLTGCRMVLDGKRYVVGIGIDISERKKLEGQLHQAQKLEAIGALAGGIAHDFNNILSAIIGYASILQMKMKPHDALRHHVEHILASSERAAGLTKSLLAFTRKQPIELKPVNINEMICGFQKILTRLIGEDIDFRVNTALGDLVVESDKGQLEQVLMNLVMNSRDAMPLGGKLIVTTDRVAITDNHGEIPRGSYAVITVTDTGCGMDKIIQEHIFEPFFTTKEVGKGTGLGLAIVYGVIKKHNGFIHVYSEPGMGTTFKIYLPRISRIEQAESSQQQAPLLHGTETILLIEDDSTVRNVTKDILKEFGYTVLEAVNGENAVKVFRENQERVQIVLCDLIMPKMNGQKTYEELLKICPGLKVIFMSGYTADIINQKGILGQGTNFISKPMSLTDLLNKVRTVLDS